MNAKETAASSDEETSEIQSLLRDGACSTISFFQNVTSSILSTISSKPEHVLNLSRTTLYQISQVSPLIEILVKSALNGQKESDLESVVERGFIDAQRAIEEANAKLAQLILTSQTLKLDVHASILAAAQALTKAIAFLIQCATQSQQEIVAIGKGKMTLGAFYKKNNKWTDGLISAAQAVANGTVDLVGVADGLVSGTKSMEELVVSAQEVSVATTQLVAASRVKAEPGKTQYRLEDAAAAVREATKLLVKAAKSAAQVKADDEARRGVGQMGKHEAKVKEMEQQVRILELEKSLSTARYTLGEMRKQAYRE